MDVRKLSLHIQFSIHNGEQQYWPNPIRASKICSGWRNNQLIEQVRLQFLLLAKAARGHVAVVPICRAHFSDSSRERLQSLGF